MKRKMFATLLIFALIISACGCSNTGTKDSSSPAVEESAQPNDSGDSGSDEQITINFLNKYPEAEYLAYFEGAVADYEAANPNVDIVMESVSDQAIKDKLSVMASGGDLPDVFFSWSGEYVKKFARAGLIADLTSYVEADTQWSGAFLPAFLKNSTFDGHTYGIPYRSSALFMLYNKAIFENLNLQVPETWDEFMTVCETLKNNDITPISFGNSQTWYSAWWIGTFNAMLVNSQTLSNDYNPETGDFSDPQYVNAIQHFIDLNNAGYFGNNVNSKDYYQVREEFCAGMSGMIMDATSQFSIYSEDCSDPWGFFVFPQISDAEGDKGYNTGGAEVYCVSEKSEHKDAAVDFIKFMTSKDQAIKQTAESGLPNCIAGGITADNSSPELVEGMGVVLNDMTNIADWLDTAVDGRVADAYMTSVQECFDGKSAEEAMEDVKTVAAEVKETMAE